MSTKRDILEISCKVLGLVCLIWGISYIPFATSIVARLVKRTLAATNDQAPRNFAMIAIPVVQFLSAFFLLKCSKGIASLLIRDDGPVQISVGKDWQKPLYTLCLRVVGAVMVVKAIAELIRALPMLMHYRGLTRQMPQAIWGQYGGQFISAIAYLVLGIYFVGGAKLLVRIALKGSMRESD